MSDLYHELEWRGLVFDATRDTQAFLAAEAAPIGYIGFDPTASSLHVGSLVPVMALVHLQRAGGRPLVIVGGGTGMVGDPSGRESERSFMEADEIAANLEGMRKQLAQFIDFSETGGARMVNNLDWLGPLSLLGFLREAGKYYTVNQMLAKDSVRLRLDRAREGGLGISFTEFTYMLMQAYDFLHVHDRWGCRFQMGGSDQWGNITAGIELIGRLRNVQAYGLVMPLVTMASGAKFGKSTEGNVWLDPARTSPYRFYQYWINTPDGDAERFLKYFTLLPQAEIAACMTEHARAPEKRRAQETLACDLTRRVHGADGLARAQRASLALFGGSLEELSNADLADVFADVPSVLLPAHPEFAEPFSAADLFVWCGLAKSRGEARRLAEGGGLYLNNRRVDEVTRAIDRAERLHGRYLVLRKGARHYALAEWPA
jgi:tyrosyl-tRNA synthetase